MPLLLFLNIIVSSFFAPNVVAALETTIIAEGHYVMADGDTLAMAEERVLQRAQRRAVEEAGVYFESIFVDSEKSSGGRNIQSSALEIRTLAAAITKTVVLSASRTFEQDRPTFYVRIRAHVDLDNLEQLIHRWKSEQQLAVHFRQLQTENAQLKAQLQNLQARPSEVQIIAIEPPTRSADQARKLVERAVETRDLRQKLDLSSQAAELDPESPAPLVIRGQAYLRLASIAFGNKLPAREYSVYIDNARMDFDRALRIDPKNIWALLGQGDANTWLEQPKAAAGAYEEALELDPFFDVARQRLINLHTMQARKLVSANEYLPALELLDRLLNRYVPHTWIPAAKEAYLLRSQLYQQLNQPTDAMEDLNMVLQVDPSDAQALLARGKLYRDRLQGIPAKDDFEHACLLGSTDACHQLP